MYLSIVRINIDQSVSFPLTLTSIKYYFTLHIMKHINDQFESI